LLRPGGGCKVGDYPEIIEISEQFEDVSPPSQDATGAVGYEFCARVQCARELERTKVAGFAYIHNRPLQ